MGPPVGPRASGRAFAVRRGPQLCSRLIDFFKVPSICLQISSKLNKSSRAAAVARTNQFPPLISNSMLNSNPAFVLSISDPPGSICLRISGNLCFWSPGLPRATPRTPQAPPVGGRGRGSQGIKKIDVQKSFKNVPRRTEIDKTKAGFEFSVETVYSDVLRPSC